MSRLYKYKCNNCGSEFYSNQECLLCVNCQSKRIELTEQKKFKDQPKKYDFSIFTEESMFELDELEEIEEEYEDLYEEF